jgi:hypothetical protein
MSRWVPHRETSRRSKTDCKSHVTDTRSFIRTMAAQLLVRDEHNWLLYHEYGCAENLEHEVPMLPSSIPSHAIVANTIQANSSPTKWLYRQSKERPDCQCFLHAVLPSSIFPRVRGIGNPSSGTNSMHRESTVVYMLTHHASTDTTCERRWVDSTQ